MYDTVVRTQDMVECTYDKIVCTIEAGADFDLVISASVLHLAVLSGTDCNVLRMQRDTGADVNSKSKEDVPILHSAVAHSMGPEPVSLFTEWGVYVNAKDVEDKMALPWGIIWRHLDAGYSSHCVRLLLAANIDIDIVGWLGAPLYLARCLQSDYLIAILEQAGASGMSCRERPDQFTFRLPET